MSGPTRATGAAAVSAVALTGACLLFWHTFDPVYDTTFAAAGRGPVFFPRILLGLMIALAGVSVVQSLRDRSERSGGASSWPLALAAIATTVYVFALTEVGFLIATLVYSFAMPPIFGYRRWLVLGLFAPALSVATWYVFEKVFLIILPKSPWFGVI